jgi:hypothetical protein
MKSINKGKSPLLKASTSNGVIKAVIPFAKKLSLPTESLMKFIIGCSSSTRVRGVTKTTQTRKRMKRRSQDLTSE